MKYKGSRYYNNKQYGNKYYGRNNRNKRYYYKNQKKNTNIQVLNNNYNNENDNSINENNNIDDIVYEEIKNDDDFVIDKDKDKEFLNYFIENNDNSSEKVSSPIIESIENDNTEEISNLLFKNNDIDNDDKISNSFVENNDSNSEKVSKSTIENNENDNNEEIFNNSVQINDINNEDKISNSIIENNDDNSKKVSNPIIEENNDVCFFEEPIFIKKKEIPNNDLIVKNDTQTSMDNEKTSILKYILGPLLLIIALIGTTYAYYRYYKESNQQGVITSGELYISLLESPKPTLTIEKAYPRTNSEARARNDNYVDFTVLGKNTSETKVLKYKIDVSIGNAPQNKIAISPNYLKADLYSLDSNNNATTLLSGISLNTFNTQAANLGLSIPNNTTNEIRHKYRLRVWLSDTVIISDTDLNRTYTQEEFNKLYANISINVKDNGFAVPTPTPVSTPTPSAEPSCNSNCILNVSIDSELYNSFSQFEEISINMYQIAYKSDGLLYVDNDELAIYQNDIRNRSLNQSQIVSISNQLSGEPDIYKSLSDNYTGVFDHLPDGVYLLNLRSGPEGLNITPDVTYVLGDPGNVVLQGTYIAPAATATPTATPTAVPTATPTATPTAVPAPTPTPTPTSLTPPRRTPLPPGGSTPTPTPTPTPITPPTPSRP